jgi:ubiquinone/menaquinone biosynthesis C-methylase UbiE
LITDPHTRFTATAERYHAYRPSYPPALVDWVLALPGLPERPVVADVACGTGITTRLFAARDCEVIGVDPNEEMLAYARAGGARVSKGTAEATGLPSATVDLVTVGQGFHWFDLEAALRELARILRPSGWCAAFWNTRARSAFLDGYERLLLESSTEYARIKTPEQTIEEIRAAPGVASVRTAEFANAQVLDRAGVFGRAHSSSYVAHGVADREGFDRALAELFDAHHTAGVVEFAYRALVIAWQPAAAGTPGT